MKNHITDEFVSIFAKAFTKYAHHIPDVITNLKDEIKKVNWNEVIPWVGGGVLGGLGVRRAIEKDKEVKAVRETQKKQMEVIRKQDAEIIAIKDEKDKIDEQNEKLLRINGGLYQALKDKNDQQIKE